MTPLQMVREFHEAFGVPAYSTPREPPEKRLHLRYKLCHEEHHELATELLNGGTIERVAKELADNVVVIYGTALEYGIDLDAVLEEVHASNMAKLGSDGKPILREDGKVLKPEGWNPPDIRKVLERQELFADAQKWYDALPVCACSDTCHGSDAEHRYKTAPK